MTAELLQWMPSDVRQSMTLQLPESLADTGKTGLPLIAEAMARGLSFAYDGVADARSLRETRSYQAMGGWIRDAMDHAHREVIFGDFLKLYEEALVRHSEPAILQEVEELPASSLIRLYLSLAGNPPSTGGQKMLALGQALGTGLRQLSLGALYFGSQEGIFRDLDFGLTPAVKAQAGALGPGPDARFQLIDAGYFEMLHQFENVPRIVERDWGALHPLVRGFSQHYDQDPWVREQGVLRLRRGVDEVEDFVTKPRH